MFTPWIIALTVAASPTVFERYVDASEGAFVVRVPRGWQTRGGMMRVQPDAMGGPGQSIEAKIDFTVQRDAGVQVRWLPHVNHIAPAPGVILPVQGGMVTAPVPSPEDFLLKGLLPWLRPRATDVQVLSTKKRPDITAALTRGPKAQSLRAQGAYWNADAAVVDVAYLEGGVAFRESLFVAIEVTGVMGTTLWSNAFTVAARAPAAEFTSLSPVAVQILNSFALNPRWVTAELQGQQTRGAIAKKALDDIAAIDREITENRRQTMASIQQEQYLTLTGQERYQNPLTGDEELGSSAWKHRWVDAWGREFYTDDADWDPNRDPALHLQGFRRTPVAARK